MANTLTTQVLEDGARFNVTKVDFEIDTSDLAETLAVDFPAMSITNPPSSEVKIDRLDYSIQDPISVQIIWQADTGVRAMDIAGRGTLNFWGFGGILNTAGAGKTGSITLTTKGYTSGTIGGTIVFTTVKRSTAATLASGRLLTELDASLQAETGAFININ